MKITLTQQTTKYSIYLKLKNISVIINYNIPPKHQTNRVYVLHIVYVKRNKQTTYFQKDAHTGKIKDV